MYCARRNLQDSQTYLELTTIRTNKVITNVKKTPSHIVSVFFTGCKVNGVAHELEKNDGEGDKIYPGSGPLNVRSNTLLQPSTDYGM